MEILYDSTVTRTSEFRESWEPVPRCWCPVCGQRGRVFKSENEVYSSSHLCAYCGNYFELSDVFAPEDVTPRSRARLTAIRSLVPEWAIHHRVQLSDEQYRALLDLMMCSDPWPLDGESGDREHGVLVELLDAEAKRRGWDNWVVAYHEFKCALPIEVPDAE